MSASLKKKTVRDIDVAGKTVVVRVDFNVPLDNGQVSDDTRITAALPTIEYLCEHGAKVVLISHLGRPKGEFNLKYSLAPVAAHLSLLLGKKIPFAKDCIGAEPQALVSQLQAGDVLLLENLRFYKEEEANDLEFAKKLASLGDLYVNDAFGTAHRAHASTHGITQYLPAVAGLLMEKELLAWNSVLAEPQHPLVAIIGGAKVSDKISVIENLLTKVDTLLIGGGMANTFLAAQGCEMQKSLIEADKIELAKSLLASANGKKILLPVDVVAAAEFKADAPSENVAVTAVPAGWQALDIGSTTVEAFSAVIALANLIVWNGPLGVFEMPAFAQGTLKICQAVAAAPGFSVIGGGDSVAAVEQSGVAAQIGHISTGGGASLELLEGKILPGVDVLLNLS